MSNPILALPPVLHDFGLVWALVIVGLVLAWVQQRRPLVQYLFFLRFPLLLATLLLLLPILGGSPGSTTLRNLFILDASGIVWASWVTLMAGWVVASTAGLIGRLAPDRFGIGPFRMPRALGWLGNGWGRLFLAILLATPTFWRAVTLSPEPWGMRFAAVALGVSLALLVGALATLVESLIVSPDRATSQLTFGTTLWPFAAAHKTGWAAPRNRKVGETLSRAVSPRWGAGYVDYRSRRILPDHLVAAVLVALTAVIYVVGFIALRPDRPWFDLPALAYLLTIVLILAWALPAASFFADRYRLPLLVLVASLSFLLYFAFDIDHYYELAVPDPAQAEKQAGTTPSGVGLVAYDPAAATDAAPPPASQALGPAKAYRARREAQARARNGDSGVIVAVAASGGGITASLWTAQVLAGLSQTIPGFADSLHVISSVSGGSVGAMYYVDEMLAQRGAPKRAGERSFEQILERAGHSSLAATAWGFVYPDLWRAFPLARFAGLRWASTADLQDRGWALEQSWRRELRRPDARLSHWREAVEHGAIPAMLFNATVTETGERFIMSPVDLPTRRRTCGTKPRRAAGAWQALSLSALYPGNDLPVATAARLSATFPYVSPITRAQVHSTEQCGYHLADGGYFDNFGIVSLENWLGELMAVDKGNRLLLVEIRASEEAEPALPEPRNGWIFATLGPFRTLMEVRTPSQRERNDLLVGNLRRRWLERNGANTFHKAVFDLRYRSAPLSWQLSADEREGIRDAWAHRALKNEVAEARKFFDGEGVRNTPPPAVRLLQERARETAVSPAEQQAAL